MRHTFIIVIFLIMTACTAFAAQEKAVQESNFFYELPLDELINIETQVCSNGNRDPTCSDVLVRLILDRIYFNTEKEGEEND